MKVDQHTIQPQPLSNDLSRLPSADQIAAEHRADARGKERRDQQLAEVLAEPSVP